MRKGRTGIQFGKGARIAILDGASLFYRSDLVVVCCNYGFWSRSTWKARLHFLGAYKKLEFDLCERLLSTNRFQKQKFDLTILLSSLVSSFFVECSSNFANFSFGL